MPLQLHILSLGHIHTKAFVDLSSSWLVEATSLVPLLCVLILRSGTTPQACTILSLSQLSSDTLRLEAKLILFTAICLLLHLTPLLIHTHVVDFSSRQLCPA